MPDTSRGKKKFNETYQIIPSRAKKGEFMLSWFNNPKFIPNRSEYLYM